MRRTCTPRPPAAVFALLLGCLLGGPGSARAQAPNSPAFYLAPHGYRTKEFTLVRTDAWFHLFYIRENLIVGAATERSLGHAISRDLYTWTEQDTILPVIEGTYEGSQIWAPHLIKSGGLWRMFYPAMRDDPADGYHLAQTITSATSPDLYAWTRRETPLFDNSIFPWAHHDTTVNLGMDCRDPFVWWDDVHGEWLMYVATRPASQPSVMAIGIAGSSDLETWTDRGLVPLTLPNVSFSNVAESPVIYRRNAASPLLFMWTTNSGQALTYGTSNDPVTGWTNSRRLRAMLGYTTTGWWASETLVDGARQYFASVHDTWIDFWDMAWTSDEAFMLFPPDRAQALSASFDRPDAMPGDTVRVEVASINAVGRRLPLQWVRIRGSYTDTLNAAAWGLPDSVTVEPDSAVVRFEVSPMLGDGRTCLLSVAPDAGGTLPPDTLRIGVPEIVYQDPPDPPEPLFQEFTPFYVPRLKRAQFHRAPAAVAWTVDVFDVRGRLCWSGRGAAGETLLEWPVGAARAGVYFARARTANGATARGKFVVF